MKIVRVDGKPIVLGLFQTNGLFQFCRAFPEYHLSVRDVPVVQVFWLLMELVCLYCHNCSRFYWMMTLVVFSFTLKNVSSALNLALVFFSDIDECITKTDNCSATQPSKCVNTDGGYRCDCARGFTHQSGQWSRCVLQNDCSVNGHRCGPGQTCQNTFDSQVCCSGK